MSFLDKMERIKNIASAKLNDIIDKQETPELLMKETIRKMNEQLNEMNEALATSISVEKDIDSRAHNAAEEALKWAENANIAVKNGDDALAKQALKNKIMNDNHAAEMNKILSETKESTAKIKMKIASIESEIEEAKIKQSVLIAKQRTADAKNAYIKVAGDGSTSSNEVIARMEEKVTSSANSADAYDEAMATNNKNIADKLNMEDKIAEELKKLKRQTNN